MIGTGITATPTIIITTGARSVPDIMFIMAITRCTEVSAAATTQLFILIAPLSAAMQA
jgi:hypothetical protein